MQIAHRWPLSLLSQFICKTKIQQFFLVKLELKNRPKGSPPFGFFCFIKTGISNIEQGTRIWEVWRCLFNPLWEVSSNFLILKSLFDIRYSHSHLLAECWIFFQKKRPSTNTCRRSGFNWFFLEYRSQKIVIYLVLTKGFVENDPSFSIKIL